MDEVPNNRALIERFAKLTLAGDMATAASLVHDDFVIREAPGLPYAGEYKGFAGLMELFGKMVATWREMAIETRSVIGAADADEFALLMQVSGTSTATGRPFSTEVLERWVIRDGKIAEIWPYYWDTRALADLHAST